VHSITNEVLYQLSYWAYAKRRLNGRGPSRKAESEAWYGAAL